MILAFGDSLTAGLNIPHDKSFPAQLQAALREKGYPVRVLNSGVSGDTAADGLARLDWSLDEKVDGAIVELGANDALRGIEPKTTERALGEILKTLKDKHIEVLLAGMEAPRNWGQDYDNAFRGMYPRLAQEYGTLLYPFFLKDVATVQKLEPCRRPPSRARRRRTYCPQYTSRSGKAHRANPGEARNEP